MGHAAIVRDARQKGALPGDEGSLRS